MNYKIFALISCVFWCIAVNAQSEKFPKSHYLDSILQSHADQRNDTSFKGHGFKDFGYMNNLDSLLREQNNKYKSRKVTVTVGRDRPANRALINFLNNDRVQFFLWTIAIAFLLFLLYKLFFQSGFFKKNAAVAKVEGAEEDGRELEQLNIYQSRILEAENNLHYDLAIRQLYLALLKELSDLQLINFTAEKTNHEYASEIADDHLRKNFLALTKIYEYIWYGKSAISKENYVEIKKEFTKFNTG